VSQLVGIEARSVRDLGMRDAKDRDIYHAAKKAEAIVMTKGSDFLV
jgi:predicted nuclease of predicted toxin-antitoxin system